MATCYPEDPRPATRGRRLTLVAAGWYKPAAPRPSMQDLTTGSLTRHLVTNAGYMLVSMTFQTLYILIDLYWVGHLGTTAVAAVGISSNVMFLVLAGSQMLGAGTTALVSQATGRKDRAEAERVFNQAQVLSLGIGAAFLVLALGLHGPYTRALAADPGTAALAAGFLRWFVPAMALQFGFIAMASGLRATGDFRTGMIVQTATVLLNLVLAPALMFGWTGWPALGVPGAAISSLCASGLGTVWLASVFVRPGAYLRMRPSTWAPAWALWRRLLVIGAPAGAEFALLAAYLMLVYTVIRPFGAEAQAGFGIGMRILQACFMPAIALGFAAGPVAGQNVGAGHGARVRRTFTVAASLAAGGMSVFALAMWVAGARLVAVFTSDAAVIRVGEEYLHVVACSFAASGVIFVTSSLFQALGNSVPSLVSSVTRLGLVAAPVLLLAGHPAFRLQWVWYISAASVGVQLVVSLALLRREFRLRLPFDTAAATGAR